VLAVPLRDLALQCLNLSAQLFEVIKQAQDQEPESSGQFVAGVVQQYGYFLRNVVNALG
jgi:hypothetical protein